VPRPMTRALLATLSLALFGAVLAPAVAQADAGKKVIAECPSCHVSDNFSQRAYNEALRELPADLIEYSACAQLIQQAKVAAASRPVHPAKARAGAPARSGGGGGGGGGPSTPAPAGFSATEKAALAAAVNAATAPVVSGLLRPGLVPAASVSTIPTPLLALLAMLAAAALALLGRLGLIRVRRRSAH
jgi:hypothetical protein